MAGRFNGNSQSLEDMQSLTGFEFRAATGDKFPVQVDDSKSTSQDFSAAAGDRPLAKKVYENWTSYYAEEPTLSAAATRNLARQAGVHQFVDADDVLYANESLVVLHAVTSGARRLRFPAIADVADLVTGTRWQSVNEIQFQADESETFLFHWKAE